MPSQQIYDQILVFIFMKVLNLGIEGRVSIEISLCDYFMLLYYVSCWGFMLLIYLFIHLTSNTHKEKKSK